jgi:Lrp/AsnC family transcriptional regulator for asnA, asnC and gidA
MKKTKLDSTDKALVKVLSENGRATVSNLAKKLEVTNPTVRSRMQALEHSGILKIAGMIDCSKVSDIKTALIAIKVQVHGELDDKIVQISQLDRVLWAAVVTGRYDIIVEILIEDESSDLYHFLAVSLPLVGGIQSSETFVVMKATNKWVLLPSSIMNW